MNPDDKITLLFDTKLGRPGCVILQAIAGLSHNNSFLQMTFDNWLTAPTPNMKRVTATRAQWERVAKFKGFEP